MLSSNPDVGTPIESIRSDYLTFSHRSHSIFYKKTQEDIFIVRLLHKSMDVALHL
jgi:toxin ParE1/3/4